LVLISVPSSQTVFFSFKKGYGSADGKTNLDPGFEHKAGELDSGNSGIYASHVSAWVQHSSFVHGVPNPSPLQIPSSCWFSISWSEPAQYRMVKVKSKNEQN